MSKDKKKIGELLIEAGLIDEFQLNSSLAYQKSWGGRLGSIVLRKGFVTEREMADVIARQYDIPCVSLAEVECPPESTLRIIKADVARKFEVFPIKMEGKNLVVAVADPTDLKILDDLGFTIGFRIKPVLALESEILRAIETNYDGKYSQGAFIISGDSIHREMEKVSPLSPASHDRAEEQPAASAEPPVVNPAREKPKADISQKVVIESLVDLLVAKGFFTKEELMQRIKSRIS